MSNSFHSTSVVEITPYRHKRCSVSERIAFCVLILVSLIALNSRASDSIPKAVDTRITPATTQHTSTASKTAFTHGAVQQTGFMDFHSDGKISGFKYALTNELARRLDWQDQHQKCPFQRCLFSMANGTLDLMIFVSATEDRFDYLNFIQVWPSTRKIPFYVRSGEENRLIHYDDLSNLRIGVVNGYAYFPQFDKDQTLQKITVTTELQLAHMLQAKRIDTYIGFEDIAVNDHYRNQLIVKAAFEKTVESSALIAISKKSPLNKKLPDIEREIINMINDRTLLKIWSQSFPDKDFPYPLKAYPKYTLDSTKSSPDISRPSAHAFEQRLPNVSTKK